MGFVSDSFFSLAKSRRSDRPQLGAVEQSRIDYENNDNQNIAKKPRSSSKMPDTFNGDATEMKRAAKNSMISVCAKIGSLNNMNSSIHQNIANNATVEAVAPAALYDDNMDSDISGIVANITSLDDN